MFWLNWMELDQTPRPNCCHLDGSPQGLIWGTFFFSFWGSCDLAIPPPACGFGGKGWCVCVCVWMHLYCIPVCVCFLYNTPLCTLFLDISCRGTLCDISIPATSQGSCDLHPLSPSSASCCTLSSPPPHPLLFLSPSLPLSPFCGLQHCFN